jgi:plasmid stability protein
MSQREQQTARVNVDDATWQAFRIRAIRANRSVAGELARLVP